MPSPTSPDAPSGPTGPSGPTDSSGVTGSSGLTDRDRRILALESRTFRYVGTKERAIREEIGLSRTAYYVRLNALLDDPRALREAPAVVNRLRARRVSADGPAVTGGADRVA